MGRKFKIFAATHGTTDQMLAAFENRIAELEGPDIEMSTDIESVERCNCGQEDCPICNSDLADIEECDIPTL